MGCIALNDGVPFKVLAIAETTGATRLLQRLVFPCSPTAQELGYSTWQMDQ